MTTAPGTSAPAPSDRDQNGGGSRVLTVGQALAKPYTHLGMYRMSASHPPWPIGGRVGSGLGLLFICNMGTTTVPASQDHCEA